MPLKGFRQTRALRRVRMAAWGVAGLLALLCVCQLRAIGGQAGAAPRGAPRNANAGWREMAASDVTARPVEEFAVIWQRMDPAPPEPEPKPEPVVKAEPPRPAPPPPDPYPEMQLLGTLTEEGHNYVLLRIRRGATKLLREGERFGDVRVVSVSEGGATVEVPNYTKALRIERKGFAGAGR